MKWVETETLEQCLQAIDAISYEMYGRNDIKYSAPSKTTNGWAFPLVRNEAEAAAQWVNAHIVGSVTITETEEVE